MKTSSSSHRRFKLRIWWLALGYFAFYVPYSFLIKIVTSSFWPGLDETVSGYRLLPGVVVGTAIILPLIIAYQGWWKYVTGRPRGLVILSGLGTAIIIGTTTLAFSFDEVSIIFALLLMRGGVLIIAPMVDLVYRRRVRWFSWAALGFTVPALLIALVDVNNYSLTPLAALTIGAYLSGYLLRIPCVTSMAKVQDDDATHCYFVEEAIAALVFLVTIPILVALFGHGSPVLELRQGFMDLRGSGVAIPALLIGALYASLYCFGTLIYLDCRENTFCIPLNRSSSLLAGVVASFALALLFGLGAPSEAQLASAAMIVVALLFLSPLHHADRYLAKLRLRFAPAPKPERLFLFVCSGNTCRSPMAAAIANAEIAARLGIAYEALETVNVRALSAGVTARVGAPLTDEASEVLRSLSVPVKPHAARNLTPELAERAELIFCMTKAQRQAVVEMLPSVAGKTYCLGTQEDIDDPIGKGMPAYIACARQIQRLVQLRFDDLGLGTLRLNTAP
jgi:protein-tyrosine-phosphatase